LTFEGEFHGTSLQVILSADGKNGEIGVLRR
jgi:hypothetical protein